MKSKCAVAKEIKGFEAAYAYLYENKDAHVKEINAKSFLSERETRLVTKKYAQPSLTSPQLPLPFFHTVLVT